MSLDRLVEAPPLLADAYDLATKMVRRFDRTDSMLGRRILGHSLELLDAVWLGLHDRDPDRLDDVDAQLVRLRLALRLWLDTGDDDRAAVNALEVVDGIGRQLGGLQRFRDRER